MSLMPAASTRFEELGQVWPGVRVEQGAFERHLSDLGLAECPAHLGDVFLAFACGHGDAKACQYFEKTYSPALAKGAARVRNDAGFVDEVVQEARHKLFVGPPPKLLRYGGKGPFNAWLRVVACRAAFDIARGDVKEKRADLAEEGQGFGLQSGLDTKLDRARYVAAFQRALEDAMRTLEPRERNMLRLHYSSGVNIDGIGLAYGVHRATVARWLSRLRDQLFERVRSELSRACGGMSDSEFSSLTRLVQSRLDIEVSNFMSSAGAGSELPRATEPGGWSDDECPRSA